MFDKKDQVTRIWKPLVLSIYSTIPLAFERSFVVISFETFTKIWRATTILSNRLSKLSSATDRVSRNFGIRRNRYRYISHYGDIIKQRIALGPPPTFILNKNTCTSRYLYPLPLILRLPFLSTLFILLFCDRYFLFPFLFFSGKLEWRQTWFEWKRESTMTTRTMRFFGLCRTFRICYQNALVPSRWLSDVAWYYGNEEGSKAGKGKPSWPHLPRGTSLDGKFSAEIWSSCVESRIRWTFRTTRRHGCRVRRRAFRDKLYLSSSLPRPPYTRSYEINFGVWWQKIEWEGRRSVFYRYKELVLYTVNSTFGAYATTYVEHRYTSIYAICIFRLWIIVSVQFPHYSHSPRDMA